MRTFFLSPLLFTGFHLPALADSAPDETPLHLPEMLITATRSDSPKEHLATASTVYTREDIERLQVNTLPELLRGSTGLDITQQGGYGKNSSVFIRGTNSGHVLVLVDGIRFGSVTSGTSPFELLPIDQIERVEIIRGPQSSLWGAEALGGVIQIFTRKGAQKEKPTITIDAGGGSFNTAKASGTISGRYQNSWYTLGASHFNSQGFDARQPTTGFFGVDEPDKDGFYNTGLNARLGHRFDNNAEMEATYMRSEGRNDFDGTPNRMEFVNQVIGLSGAIDVIDNWRSTLRLGQSRDDADNFSPDGTFFSRFDSTRWNASWLNAIQLSDDHQLTLGADYRLDEADSTTDYTELSRYDVGVFGEWHGRFFDNHHLNGSIRWDENEAFGDFVTGSIGWRSNWDYGISTFANFGNGFKAPSFNQLYWPGFGNPNLMAEESKSVEVGLAGNHDWLQWEIRAYHTDLDNLIVYVFDPATFNLSAENIGKAQINGIEAEIGTQIFGWNAKLGMNLLRPVDRETNNRLPRRTDRMLSFDLSRSFGPVDVGAFLLAEGYRYDDAANTTKVSGYATVDLRSAYHINKNWTISAQLNNLLDKQYQLVDTYNTADRNFFVSIRYNI
ncbi:TonB-dependent receptor domain-containing protein [Methylotuvimicrobium alcaliphilum]|uniref:TonB-dependent receptor plug n=1 Tax=Methylotuvimicrobium alcaliphilum (strain DSM 19304 / NCIMB 14124 / VKM B-2133 / 20Z) TaxID=1091494 RepID=G4T3E6_META2|nr:TonB-dependent receptor [Methylotuvimicrobium alcaliphilum]CCE22638.1 TonB-dependent receptor plug [Methylotuvimicrobium alcaliphilum 20Z]